MAKTAKKYVAKLNGVVVGTRTTENRTYTHAIVVQFDETAARIEAHNYTATPSDHSNFKYYTEVATGFYTTHWNHKPNETKPVSEDDKKAAQAKIEGGFEGYVARRVQAAIDHFNNQVAEGYFHPKVVTWCGRHDLAQKEASSKRNWRRVKQVWIVPAEEVQ